MKTRPISYGLVLGALLAAAGCGPTKTGLEARANARERIDSFNSQFTFEQAQQDFETGQFDRALLSIEALIATFPENAKYHVLQGRICLEQNDLQDAITAFMTALEFDPQFADAHYFAGIVFQRWSDDEEAYTHYLSAYELEPDQVHYLLATAESLIALGEFDEARGLVESKLAYFENDAALRHLLGQIALLEGDSRKAARLYEEAHIMDVDNEALHEELAWVQYDAKLFGQCLETVRSIQSDSDTPRNDLLHLEARCLTMLGRAAEAHGRYIDLARANPANPAIWIEFGTLAWKLGDYRRVAECSVQTINMAPDRFEGYMLKGLYERERGRLPQAIELLRESADLCSDSVLPHLLLGRTLEQADRARDALSVYAEAISIEPESREANALYDALAETLRIATVDDEE